MNERLDTGIQDGEFDEYMDEGRRRAYLFLEVSDLGGRLVPELIGNIHDNLHPLIHQPMKGGEGL